MIKRFLIFLLITICVSACTKKDSRTVVKFASWGSKSEVAILKPILNEFEYQNPDIKLEFIHIPQNYFQKIHLLFASNLEPDVIFMNNLYLPIYARAGLLQELNEPARKGGINLSSFYDKALNSLSYNKKLYAIPRDISTLVIYYNKNLFKEFNVLLPNKYWSFEDLLILSQELTKDTDNDGKIDTWGISFDSNLLFYLPYLMSEGGGLLSDDLTTVMINTPESRKGLQFYTDLRNKYHVAPTASESASETMAQMFLQGKIAMQLSGRWLVPKYRTDAKFDWNVINFPAGDEGSIVPLDSSGWALSKNSKCKKNAIRLIKYLSSKSSIEKFTESGLIVPARIDVANGKFLEQNSKKPKNNKLFIDIIKTSKNTPVSTNYNELKDELKKKTDYLFNSTLSVKDMPWFQIIK